VEAADLAEAKALCKPIYLNSQTAVHVVDETSYPTVPNDAWVCI
jgi:hypothetical protein